jgi:hypothetical protein
MVEQIKNLVALIESQLEGPGEERMGEDIRGLGQAQSSRLRINPQGICSI